MDNEDVEEEEKGYIGLQAISSENTHSSCFALCLLRIDPES